MAKVQRDFRLQQISTKMTTYNEKSTDAAVNICSDDFEKTADATENNKSTDPTKKATVWMLLKKAK